MAKPEKRPWLKIFLGGVITGAVLLVVSAYAMLCTDQREFCSVCHIMSEAALTSLAPMQTVPVTTVMLPTTGYSRYHSRLRRAS